MNAMFTIEMLKRIIKEMEKNNIKMFSPHLMGSFERFPTFDDKPEFGSILHDFYTKKDWAIFVEPSDDTYGFPVTRAFIKKSNGYARDAINYYLSLLAERNYAVTISERNSKDERMTTLMIITDHSPAARDMLNVIVDYVGQSKARIADCIVDVIGKEIV